MRFADRRTAEAMIAAQQPAVDPAVWRPAHNRVSRRKLGMVNNRSHGAIRRRVIRGHRQPAPWKPTATSEGTE